MYLKTLSLGDIHPYERNPRINDKAVEPVMMAQVSTAVYEQWFNRG